ncbi:hypothetical protein HDU98_000189 [Podochytrium sp. JEL0797]|nr:hypothetical protein HDU98_000189 [Podochytrium sp. JEL0797]
MPLASGYQALYAPGYTWGQKFTTFNTTTTSFAACANLALPLFGNTASALITWVSTTGLCSLGSPGAPFSATAAVFAYAAQGFAGDLAGSFDFTGYSYGVGKQTTAQPCVDVCRNYVGKGWCALVRWDFAAAVAGNNCFLKGPDAADATVTAGVWVVPSPTTTASTAAIATFAAANSSATTASGGDGGGPNVELIVKIVAAIVVLGLLGGGYWLYSKKRNQVEVQEPKSSQAPFSDKHASSLAAGKPDTFSTVIQVPVNKERNVVVPEPNTRPVGYAVVPDHKTDPVVDKLMAVMGNLASPLPPRDTKPDYYGEDPTVAVSAFEAKGSVQKCDYYGDDPTVAVSAFEAMSSVESTTSQRSADVNGSTGVSSTSHQSMAISLADVLSWTLQDVAMWVMENGGSPGAGLRTAREKITGVVLVEIEEDVLVRVVKPATVGDRHQLVTALRKLKVKTQLLTGPPSYFDF